MAIPDNQHWKYISIWELKVLLSITKNISNFPFQRGYSNTLKFQEWLTALHQNLSLRCKTSSCGAGSPGIGLASECLGQREEDALGDRRPSLGPHDCPEPVQSACWLYKPRNRETRTVLQASPINSLPGPQLKIVWPHFLLWLRQPHNGLSAAELKPWTSNGSPMPDHTDPSHANRTIPQMFSNCLTTTPHSKFYPRCIPNGNF